MLRGEACETKKTQKADFLNKGIILRNLQVHKDNNVWKMMHSLFTFKIASVKCKGKKGFDSFSREIVSDFTLFCGLALRHQWHQPGWKCYKWYFNPSISQEMGQDKIIIEEGSVRSLWRSKSTPRFGHLRSLLSISKAKLIYWLAYLSD